MSDLPFWLALNRISTLGARRIRHLVKTYGDAKSAYYATEKQLSESGLPPKVLASFLREREQIKPQEEWQRCRDLGISVVIPNDTSYPVLLKEIYDPPAVLYYRGDLQVLSQFTVAVVGSRKTTTYGRTAAEKLASDLARQGVVIVSGMARGIDTCAHRGALSASGKTAAVLGSGLDICYPPENRALMEKIVQNGVVISEFPPGTQPKPAHFPMRNRIISGLSYGVVVVEAAEKSGALITTDFALEQGREVFAVPGSIHSPQSRGCHRLLKEGAEVCETAADVLLALGKNSLKETAAAVELTPKQAAVLTVLEFEPVHFDQLVALSGLPAAELSGLLLELELAGFLKKMVGNYYLRV
ncbi:MAG: DNA-protecting protein DprA [Firmicutes bacterium]|nr:DNA-protecting protein DprA [Bacillota bacterium]